MDRFKTFITEEVPARGTPAHKSFLKHGRTLDVMDREAIELHKFGGTDPDNANLRKGHPVDDEEHIHHMSKVTNNRTEHDHTLYRGGVPNHENYKPGHKYHDKGFTGTSFHKGVARNASINADTKTKEGKHVIHVIHAPKGTKGHYIDMHTKEKNLKEGEFLMHPGTHFEVTHHSSDDEHHFIHSKVLVGK